MISIRKSLLRMACGSLLAMLALSMQAYDLRYTVRFDTAGHYLDVTLDYQAAPVAAPAPVTLKMALWAPGYYELLNFPKHLCDFSVATADGDSLLGWRKEGKNAWTFTPTPDNHVRVHYRVYANQRDVASSRVEKDVAFVAPSGVFMYLDGEQDHPVTVTFDKPSNWGHISSGLRPHADDASTYTAPDFDILFDSPFLLGNPTVRNFQLEGRDYELAFETPEGLDESGFVDDFRRIVEASTQIMGDVPYENYTLIHMGEGGGGLEHLNSQACYSDGTFRFPNTFARMKYLAFTAHEYFHLYNVKRIRPIELGPFNYDQEAFTPLLWFSEGITCYYESRVLRLAGIATPTQQLELLSNYLSMDEAYEGHLHQSLRQASYDIWLNFMNDDANSHDVRINYYFRGPTVGLLMDIEIRRLSEGQRSLDDLMRLLYNRYHKELGRGFTEEEFWAAVDEVAGKPMSHIRHIVDVPGEIDYDGLLAPAGLRLDRQSLSIQPIEKPSKQQLRLRNALLGEFKD